MVLRTGRGEGVKRVVGVPGDRFAVARDGQDRVLVIQDQVARNSLGESYTLDTNAEQMLGLYVRDHHGVIPPRALLVMGNLRTGTVDSTRMGLVALEDVVGKVFMPDGGPSR